MSKIVDFKGFLQKLQSYLVVNQSISYIIFGKLFYILHAYQCYECEHRQDALS